MHYVAVFPPTLNKLTYLSTTLGVNAPLIPSHLVNYVLITPPTSFEESASRVCGLCNYGPCRVSTRILIPVEIDLKGNSFLVPTMERVSLWARNKAVMIGYIMYDLTI